MSQLSILVLPANQQEMFYYMKKLRLPQGFLVRLAVLFCGLFCIAFGVALSTKSGLGVSPSASLPFLLAKLMPVSMGTFTTLINVIFIFVQIALLRKNYNPVQLLQLGVVILFGFFTDFTISLVSGIEVSSYPLRLVLCILSCAVMAFGVFLEVKAGLIVMASEGALNAASQVFGADFGRLKMGLDCGFVIVSTCVSFIFFRTLLGIREGTVIAAVLVGLFVQLYNRKLRFIDTLLGIKPVSVVKEKPTERPLIITIERELGSGGHEIGERLAKELSIAFYDYSLIAKTAEETGFSPDDIKTSEERLESGLLYKLYKNIYATSQSLTRQDSIFLAQSKVITELADTGSCVIVGRLGSYVLKEREKCFHIFISANESFRAGRISEHNHITIEETMQRLRREDAFRRNYCQHFTGEPWGLARHYALCIDTSVYGIDGAVKLIRSALQQQEKA